MLECRGGGIYVGIAKDVQKRFETHMEGRGALYTRINKPVRILSTLKVGLHGDAIRLERKMKRLSFREKRSWATALGLGADIEDFPRGFPLGDIDDRSN